MAEDVRQPSAIQSNAHDERSRAMSDQYKRRDGQIFPGLVLKTSRVLME